MLASLTMKERFAQSDRGIYDNQPSTMSFINERGGIPLQLRLYGTPRRKRVNTTGNEEKLNVLPGVITEINAMYCLYVKLTELMWPKEWVNLDNLPLVREEIMDYRKNLYDGWKNSENEDPFSAPASLAGKCGADLGLPELDGLNLTIPTEELMSILPVFLGIGKAAADMKCAVKDGLIVIEAETRQKWDEIMSVIFGLKGIGRSPHTPDSQKVQRLERVLGAPYKAAYRDNISKLRDHALLIMDIRRLGIVNKDQKASETAQGHFHRDEPMTMKADAIIVATCRPSISARTTIKKLNTISLVHARAKVTSKNNSNTDVQIEESQLKQPSSRSSSKHGNSLVQSLLSLQVEEKLEEIKRPLANVRAYKYGPDSNPPASPLQSLVKTDIETEYLLMPFCVVEHKKSEHTAEQAMNQARLYAFSTAAFYGLLGVKESIPIFSIVTFGTEAVIFLSWFSIASVPDTTQPVDSKQVIFMFEQEMLRFDIAWPLDCYRFCTFLLRLRIIGEELQKKFDSQNYADIFFKAVANATPERPLHKWKMPLKLPAPTETGEPQGEPQDLTINPEE
ncbi:hypothetical protein H0H87_012213 [Tephrocybe sp. NHM501043]|nr:hypothetical protein H0H87_012213 [Tephrocybe sp. NHM501043]